MTYRKFESMLSERRTAYQVFDGPRPHGRLIGLVYRLDGEATFRARVQRLGPDGLTTGPEAVGTTRALAIKAALEVA